MKLYIGIDDTDNRSSRQGTGRLSRRLARQLPLPQGTSLVGVVRQQHFISDAIAYTSHNSSACLVLEIADRSALPALLDAAVAYLEAHAAEGSDPGLCMVCAGDAAIERLAGFGLETTRRVVTRRSARDAAGSCHLSGHGGTCDGIIGAAAAVGLTHCGWYGRYIGLNGTDLRSFGETARVADLERLGIHVFSIDRDAVIPDPDDRVITHHWIRPRRLGHRAVLMVTPAGRNLWENLGRKRRKPGAGGRFTPQRPARCDSAE